MLGKFAGTLGGWIASLYYFVSVHFSFSGRGMVV